MPQIQPADLVSAYEDGVSFKNIEFKPKSLTQDQITEIVGGVSDDEFAIINKYNDILTKDGEEIFVTVIGAGNVIREQGLNGDEEAEDINLYLSKTYLQDAKWVTEGEGENKKVGPAVAYYIDEYSGKEVVCATLEEAEKAKAEGKPYEWRIAKEGETPTTKVIAKRPVLIGPEYQQLAEKDFAGLINMQAVKDGDSDGLFEFSEGAAGPFEMGFQRPATKWENNGEISDSGILLTVADSFEKSILSWFPQLPTYFKTVVNEKTAEEEERTFIDPRKDDQITVIVSKIKPSKIEAGKSTIAVVETFTGSIFKGSVDQISGESNYIGDIINEDSNFISFYGKANYNVDNTENKEKVGFKPEEDSILVTNLVPYRFSWSGKRWISGYTDKTDAKGNKIPVTVKDPHTGESTDEPVIDENGEIVYEQVETWKNEMLNKALAAATATSNDIVKFVLNPALHKVRNNITYLFRDVYDCGLSSVIAYAEAAIDPTADLTDNIADAPTYGLYYIPTKTNVSEKQNAGFLNTTVWKKAVLEFARFCQYKHKLSMFHADSPRKLVLNGNLSRCDDLYQDQLETVFTAKKIQLVSIKDNTYMQQNAQWYEVSDEFNKTMMWIPNSIIIAKDITNNDINGQVWNAPAGRRYAPVKGVKRVAFNPEQETMDRLYSNCINYAVAWPDGTITIEGQKTAYSEISTLNRIKARRTLIWLERYTQTVSHNYIYEPNTSDVRARYVADLDQEFRRAYTTDGLYAYRIVCDEQNNPAEVIDRNELRVAIMVQVVKDIEFVIANFIITKTGVNLEEISPVF
jgi:hypothetical protein